MTMVARHSRPMVRPFLELNQDTVRLVRYCLTTPSSWLWTIGGHPFMTSKQRGRGVRLRWTHADAEEVSAPCGRPHIKYLNLSPLTSSCVIMQRSWRFLDQNFVFRRNKKWKFFFNIIIII